MSDMSTLKVATRSNWKSEGLDFKNGTDDLWAAEWNTSRWENVCKICQGRVTWWIYLFRREVIAFWHREVIAIVKAQLKKSFWKGKSNSML